MKIYDFLQRIAISFALLCFAGYGFSYSWDECSNPLRGIYDKKVRLGSSYLNFYYHMDVLQPGQLQIETPESLEYKAKTNIAKQIFEIAVARWNDSHPNIQFLKTYFNGTPVHFLTGGSSNVVSSFNGDCELNVESINISLTSAKFTTTSEIYNSGVAVVLHELGHALGLNHTDNSYSIMGSHYSHFNSYGGDTFYLPGIDATAGASMLYGRSPGTDVGVTYMDYCGSATEGDDAGNYANHCRIPQNAATAVSGTDGGRNDVYFANSNQNFSARFKYENYSNISKRIFAKFYLSADSNIEPTDSYLTTQYLDMQAGAMGLATSQIMLPGDLTSGSSHYLGVIISTDEPELNDKNNRSYIPIRIQNGRPTAIALSFSGNFGQKIIINPTISGQSYDVMSQPTNGLAADWYDGITYTPRTGFHGSDLFRYRLTTTYGFSPDNYVFLSVAAPTAEIQAMYQKAFGRAPTTPELENLLASIKNEGLTLAQAEGRVIDALYMEVMGRPATADEIATGLAYSGTAPLSDTVRAAFAAILIPIISILLL